MTDTALAPTSVWQGFTYATPRDPTRRTRGAKVAQLAKLLGWTPMPWQQRVWDVALEVDERGRYVYEKVVITVPRQSGKTTLFGPVQIHRALTDPGCKTYFTAQTGDDARTLMKALIAKVDSSPLSTWADAKRSAAGTGIVWPNGSENWTFAPLPEKLHGKTPVLVGMDEIWVFDELRGKELLDDAIVPAQVTLGGRRQVWLFSTAGTAESGFLKRFVKIGRESVERPDRHPAVAYFEASLPDDADPYDPDAIAAFHPAVGYTQDIADLMKIARGEVDNPDGEKVDRATWLRAYCNRWTEASNPLIPDWAELADPTIGAGRREIAITWDVAPDNTMGAVLATWRNDAGRPCTRVIHAAPDTQWMEPLLLQLHKWKPAVFGADDGGNTRGINDRLRRALGADAVTTLNGVERGIADYEWLTAARDQHELIHDGSKTLSNAVAHLVQAATGDVKRFSRSKSTGPVAAVIASSVGLYLYDHRPAPEWAPATRY